MCVFTPSASTCRQHSWAEWPAGLRDRDPRACDALATQLAPRLREFRFRQFVFDCQWRELRDYANRRGVQLFGDIPIYVHFESADVWAHQRLFDLDAVGRPVTVTGVPPDYFCAEGQLWGNPQYNWASAARDRIRLVAAALRLRGKAI